MLYIAKIYITFTDLYEKLRPVNGYNVVPLMYYTNHCCLYPSYKCGNMTGKQEPRVSPSHWCNGLMVSPSSRSPIHPSTTPTLTHTQSEEEGRSRQTQAAAIFGGSICATSSTYRCPFTLTYIRPADATIKATHTHTFHRLPAPSARAVRRIHWDCLEKCSFLGGEIDLITEPMMNNENMWLRSARWMLLPLLLLLGKEWLFVAMSGWSNSAVRWPTCCTAGNFKTRILCHCKDHF